MRVKKYLLFLVVLLSTSCAKANEKADTNSFSCEHPSINSRESVDSSIARSISTLPSYDYSSSKCSNPIYSKEVSSLNDSKSSVLVHSSSSQITSNSASTTSSKSSSISNSIPSSSQSFSFSQSNNTTTFQPYFDDIDDVYYPYSPTVKAYLEDYPCDVEDYYYSVNNQAYPITINWVADSENILSIKFIYSLNIDFSDSIVLTLDQTARSIDLFNLYKNSTYYCKLVFKLSQEEKTIETSFKTTDLGPRTIKIDGIFNTRDLGGYVTENGARTKQGILFRGGALSRSIDNDYASITEDGGLYMKNVLKIKSDFDLRSKEDNLGLEQSPIPGASIFYFDVGSYSSAFTSTSTYKVLFQELAKKDNYPIYLHCTAGADRTGTVAFLLNALCGISEIDLIHDYEFTSFSIYWLRSIKPGFRFPFYDFYEKLKMDYTGNTLSEKVSNYLLSIGLTLEELNSIKTIMTE